MKQLLLTVGVLTLTSLTLQAQEIAAQNVTKTTHEKLGITVIATQFALPAAGWELDEASLPPELKWVYLDYEMPPASVRYRKIEQLKKAKKANYVLWRLSSEVRKYAQTHDRIGPASIEDLDWSTQRLFSQSPYERDNTAEAKLANQETRIRSQIESFKRTQEYMGKQMDTLNARLKKNQSELAATNKKIEELEEKDRSAEETAQLKRHKQVAASLNQAGRDLKESMERSRRSLAEYSARVKMLEAELAAQVAERKAAVASKTATEKEAEPTPYFFLIPKVVTEGAEKPVILELRPYLDDGRHYVAFSSGRVRRVDIDSALLKEHNVSVKPLNAKVESVEQSIQYILLGQLLDAHKATVTVQLVDPKAPGTSRKLTVDLSNAKSAEDLGTLSKWASLRAHAWVQYAAIMPGSPCEYWLSRIETLYGDDTMEDLQDLAETMGMGNRRRGRGTSVFNVFGGRAAIRETLQTQVIDVDKKDQQERIIPVDSIEGVTVKSHDYTNMLAGKPGGQLKIAELVPADRFMAYFRRPADLANFLDNGSSFMFQSGATVASTCFDHNVRNRYADMLGVGTGWSEIFLKSNLVNEVAAFAPDIFFIDGTDLTVIMDVKQMDLLAPLLKTIGVSGLGNDTVVVKKGTDGRKSYWYANANHLVIATNLKEMAQVRKLMNANGTGSLGKSDEFRYMLTKLPITSSTWAFAYMSDPFIRRLVGPEVKIGQYRRMMAQAEMEALSAAALLYKVDGHLETPTINKLVELGYAHNGLESGDYILHDDLSVTSATYGRPGKLTSIQALNIRKVSAAEKTAYGTYMENYNRFWRQFFDPIAVRLDKKESGEMEAEVFILPLIDSSIYQSVKQIIGVPEQGPKMRVPQLTPPPVAMVSAKLRETVWLDALGEFGTRAFEEMGIQHFPFDELGPSVHFAVMDGDPVIALGSGDILGAFNSNINNRLFGRNSEMLIIPAAMTLFTRPCKLMVELRNAELVLQSLRDAATTTIRLEDEFSVSFSQIRGKDSWMVTFDIAGLAKMRFGLKVESGYLVISNLPWNDSDVLKVAVPDTLDSAAIHIQPAAGVEQLPGLFAAANSSKRKSSFRSIARLWPMMAAGATDLNQAVAWHKTVYGFTPKHPDDGAFELDGRAISSKLFGSPERQFEPEYEPGNRDFGLFGKIKILTLSMQFEEDGLRTRVRWTLTK